MVEVNKNLKLKHTVNLSVLSYNLLAQCLLEKNMSLYGNGHPDHLDWDFRKESLLKELSQSAADVSVLVVAGSVDLQQPIPFNEEVYSSSWKVSL